MRLPIQLLTLLISFGATAQNMPRTRITIVPSQLIFLELPITIERAIGRSTIGMIGGFRPAVMAGGKISGIGEYQLQNYWNFAYNGATVGSMHKYHLRDRFGLHLETSVLFRRWWFYRKPIDHSDGDQAFTGLRSEEQEVWILKLVIGKSIIWKKEGRPFFIMEFFAGPSIRWKSFRFTTHSGSIEGSSVVDHLDEGEIWSPGLQSGLRLGFGFQ